MTNQERFSLIPPTCSSPVQYVNKALATVTHTSPSHHQSPSHKVTGSESIQMIQGPSAKSNRLSCGKKETFERLYADSKRYRENKEKLKEKLLAETH